MIRQILAHYPWATLNTLGLLIFFSFFIALVWFIHRPAQRRIHESIGRLPFEDETPLERSRDVRL